MLPAMQRCANEPLDVTDASGLRGRRKGDGFPRAFGTARPPNPVDVVRGIIGEIVIDNQCDICDINAA